MDRKLIYYQQVVSDAIYNLKRHGTALIFNHEQLKEIQKKIRVEITRVDNVGIYLRKK